MRYAEDVCVRVSFVLREQVEERWKGRGGKVEEGPCHGPVPPCVPVFAKCRDDSEREISIFASRSILDRLVVCVVTSRVPWNRVHTTDF